MQTLLDLQLAIVNLNSSSATLDDVCFQPLLNGHCTITSPLTYFQANVTNLFYNQHNNTYLDQLVTCTRSPFNVMNGPLNTSCLGLFGGPGQPNVILGGYDLASNDYLGTSTAHVLTVLLDNGGGEGHLAKAIGWEGEFLKLVDSFQRQNKHWLKVAYSSERRSVSVTLCPRPINLSILEFVSSIQDELKRQSEAAILTVSLSYLLMFAYVTIALGRWRYLTSPRKFRLFMVEAKGTVALTGVFIVLLSVLTACGAWSLFGGSLTLLVVEVIPFLVLAVGVDNIFLLVNELHAQQDKCGSKLNSSWTSRNLVEPDGAGDGLILENAVAGCSTTSYNVESGQEDERDDSPTRLLTNVLTKIGPSLLLASSAEVTCFLLAFLFSSMPGQ